MKRYCKNCFVPLPGKAKFCPQCGQKDTDGKLKMSALIKKLWETTFHIEGKFLRTCWQLFIPGKITREFFKGKFGRYPQPLHMFAVVMFVFLFILNHTLLENEKSKNQDTYVVKTTVKTEHGDSLIKKASVPGYDQLKKQVALEDLRRDYETLPPEWRTQTTKKAVDSLLHAYNKRNGMEDTPGLLDSLDASSDTTNFVMFGSAPVHLATADMVRYSADELIERYHVQKWYTKLLLRQSIKSFSNRNALAHAYLGSLTWAILALSALMALVLSLLYRRQKRYYVEHFIFLLHYHAGLMLALSLLMLGQWLHIFPAAVYGLLFIWASYAMYRAMRNYYGQGKGKTLLKWFVFGISYFICFIFLFVTGLIVVFASF